MNKRLFQTLYLQQLITETEFQAVEKTEQQPISIHRELIIILYAGIIMLTTGAGILVYKNIDTIGHEVLIVLIALSCLACFVWCIIKSKGFATYKVDSPSILFDYVLLLGCLLLLILIAYIQFRYNTFGNKYGLAAFIPMVILFIATYYFDHLGVLSLAITNLCAWAGITVTPLEILKNNDFGDTQLIYTGLVLGFALIGLSYISIKQKFKSHFAFTYKNFGAHLLFISLLAALFYFERIYLICFLLIAVVTYFFYKDALQQRSFYFLVITALYAYIALSYVAIRIFFAIDDIGSFYLGAIYFIASGIGFIRLLMHYNKVFKNDTSI